LGRCEGACAEQGNCQHGVCECGFGVHIKSSLIGMDDESPTINGHKAELALILISTVKPV
jgi:hypothetical protein